LVWALAAVLASCSGGGSHAGSGPDASAAAGSSRTTLSGSSDPNSTGSVPSSTTAPTAIVDNTSSSGPSTAKLLEFAQCMRSHGVTNFGDGPPPGGAPGKSSYLGDSFNPNSPTVEAAEQACQKYAVASPVSPAGAAQFLSLQLKFAQCMRSNGVPDFPDPTSGQGFSIPSSIDETSSIFQSAEKKCGGFPTPPGLPSSNP
jgi:hypothetical protein